MATTTAGPVRLRGTSRYYWFNATVFVVYAASGVVLLVAGVVEAHGTALLIAGIVMTTFTVPLLVLLVSSGLRPIVIADGTVRIPRAFGSTEIPLARLSGVGLIYQYTPGTRNPAGWRLHLWDGPKDVRVGNAMVVAWRNQRVPGVRRKLLTVSRDWTFPLPHENAEYLASTKPGQVARRIYDAALARQGPGGALATEATQKTVVYNPDTMSHVAAWWSPDGTMGRARGVPPADPTKMALAGGGPIQALPLRRLRSLVTGGLGIVAWFLITGGIFTIDGAGNSHHTDLGQDLILGAGLLVLLVGSVGSIVLAVKIWRGGRRPAPPDETALAYERLAQSQRAVGARPSGPSPAAPVVPPVSGAPVVPALPVVPVGLPSPRPEVVQARRRNTRYVLATIPLFIVLAVTTSLTLGHVGHLANGETCAAPTGPVSRHPSVPCDLWRHHQFMEFIPFAVVIGVAIVTLFVFQLRAMRTLQRMSRESSLSA